MIADDHPLFRGALREAVHGVFDRADVTEAGTFEEVSEFLERGGRDVDLILLDLSMPGARGFSGLMYLRAQYPSLPVVVVSANDDPAVIRRCMEFGASGFIPKTLGIEALRAAVARVLQGEVWTPPDVDLTRQSEAETAAITRLATLTPQQVRVLMMLSGGTPQQTNRLRARRVGGDRQGPRLGDFAEARRREPHASGNRRRQDRSRALAAGAGAGGVTLSAPLAANEAAQRQLSCTAAQRDAFAALQFQRAAFAAPQFCDSVRKSET